MALKDAEIKQILIPKGTAAREQFRNNASSSFGRPLGRELRNPRTAVKSSVDGRCRAYRVAMKAIEDLR
jgi:hypothetical protein